MSYNAYTTSPTDVMRQQGIMTQVYAWMTAGLFVTGAIAMFVANTPALTALIFGNPFVLFGLLIGQIVLVVALSAALNRISTALASTMFLVYSALNGLTLSVIFLTYTQASIASTFFVTAGTFGAMSLYGYTTKRDLTSIGNLLVMGLIGFLIASIVNMFLRSELIYWITTYAGLAIFIGLTAWDTQKIKRMSAASLDETQARRVAIIGSLMLYLDFVNMFLLLLRIFGNRR